MSDGAAFALQLEDRLLQQLDVEVQPDRMDVPTLLAAEQVARAAQLEVERRDAEARSQLREITDCGEPLLGDLREHGIRRDEQVGVRPPVRPADAAAQLIELRQTVTVGAIDQNRVGARDVQAVLDDGRRHQDVGAPLDEVQHAPLQQRLGHLPMGHRDARFGHQARHHARQRLDRLDPVVDEENLPVALQLLTDRRGDRVRRELHDRGLDREAILGRRLDHRHVADSGETHLQRSRNRRRRQRQAIHTPSAAS